MYFNVYIYVIFILDVTNPKGSVFVDIAVTSTRLTEVQ
jgi:hypothetical protein